MTQLDWNGHVPQPRPLIAAKMTETELMENIRDACKSLRLRVFHCHDSRRSWGPGFPDLVIAGRHGTIYRECKDQRGTLTPEQRAWRDILQGSGQAWGLWRPSDWVTGRVWEQLERIT